MESARLSWRALRPLLLAGAAATAWLTLSAPAVSADSTSDSSSLLGGISSSVSSVAGKAAAPVDDAVTALAKTANPSAPTPSPATTPESTGPLQPLTGAATGTVDQTIEAVPVVNQIAPADTVGTATAPVVQAADSVVADAAETVFPAATDTLPVLEPVLEPVGDLISGNDYLPFPDPESLAPGLVDEATSDSDDGPGTDVEPALGRALNASTDNTDTYGRSAEVLPSSTANTGLARSSAAPDGSIASPEYGQEAPALAEVPTIPGSGSASGQSGGGPGGIAWLSTFHLNVPLTGVFRIGGPLQNSPAPVSFDPGSSPD